MQFIFKQLLPGNKSRYVDFSDVNFLLGLFDALRSGLNFRIGKKFKRCVEKIEALKETNAEGLFC